MKLTKLMVLALVLALFVCAFVACGGTTDTETQAPETQAPETQAPDSETEAPGGDTEAECTHEIVVDEKAATCSDRGYKKETCKLCGEVISETAYPKTAHTASGAATCDTDSKCTVCGEVLEAAKGHVWGEVTTTAATCTVAGKETKTCTVCNTTDVKELATLAHDIAEATEYVPATCTTEGSKTGVCSLCGQTQTVVLPAAHVVTDLGDLSALTFVDGKIQAKCTACEAVVDVTAEVRFALSFDEADVPTELAKYGDGFNYLLVYNGDQAGTVKYPPVVTAYPDATDGHTSVLTTKHNASPAITFKGELLADADYYVISFDWRATKYGNNTNKIGAFGQAAKAFEGVAGEGDMVYAFKVDRSNGDLYDHSGKNKFGSAPAEQWYKVIVVVDNESGTAYTYVDGVCVATTQNAKWQVVEGGEYTWRFGGIYNVFHVPEFDNFEVVAIQKSVTEVGPSVDGGDEEEGDEEDDGTGCAHQCYLEYQLPTSTTPGFIKRTCLICGRVVTFEVLDHIHTPDGEADCVTDSKCTECGVIIEAAWGHNFDGEPVVIPAVPACSGSGTVVGKCTVCGDVVNEVEPAPHSFAVTSVDQLTYANGVFTAPCSACGQQAEVSEEIRLQLTFDRDIPSELSAWETATGYKFTVGEYDKSGAVVSGNTEVANGVMKLKKNAINLIEFDSSVLSDADYYVISFNWRAAKFSHTTSGQGIFGIHTGIGAQFIGVVDRMDGAFYKGGVAATLGYDNAKSSATATGNKFVANQWYTFVIVVDNNTGLATVSITTAAGEAFIAPYTVAGFQLSGNVEKAFRFGHIYNVYHLPEFDNFKVTKLNAVCQASDIVVEEKDCAIVYTCLQHGDAHTVTVAKDGAAHTVVAPTSFDENTVIKNGKVQGVCSVCGLDADIVEDVRLELTFGEADVATEVAALNAANADLALATSNADSYGIVDGALQCNAAKAFGIQHSGKILNDTSYYMISFDWIILNIGQKDGYISLCGAATSAGTIGTPFVYYARTAKTLTDDDSPDANVLMEGVVGNKWYNVNIIVNNVEGVAYVYVDGQYLDTVSTSVLKVEASDTCYWSFNANSSGHKPQYDNIKIVALATAPVLE